MNPQQILQMMMGQNPQINNNPMVQNAMQMMNNNDVQGLEKMARNLCNSKGIDINQMQNQIKQRFGLR